MTPTPPRPSKPPFGDDIHEKIKRYHWDFDYAPDQPRYPTRYLLPPRCADPFRLLLRDYVAMEAEKDHRVLGALDADVRYRTANHAEPRWIEGMKFAVPALTDAEYQGVKGAGLLISALRSPELRQGYAGQMLDEVRHAQLGAGLRRHYVKNYYDPAGFDIGQRALGNHPLGTMARAAFQTFNTGDPVEVGVSLNVVFETAYASPLLTALPQVASLNGDHALTSTFLSMQSDEVRHIANGYGLLMCVVQEPGNLRSLHDALSRHFWHQHQFIDTLLGVVSEYYAVHRPWVYRDVWEEWVVDDFIGAYMTRLAEFGLEPPARLADATRFVDHMHHSVAMTLAALWPLNFWRIDPLRDADFDWFERAYPGWHARYGRFWSTFRTLSDPRHGRIPMQDLPALPPFCQVCHVPCVVPHIDAPETRILAHAGRRYAVCSEGCAWIFQQSPVIYTGCAGWWERFHGMNLADVIQSLGYLRPDGKTLIAQPHLGSERMWTIDDIRKLDYVVRDPLAS
jgi:methane monooxygenase component A alpha chain/propane monooxygenase large subunit